MENTEFTWLWREEEEKLRQSAKHVPENGTIVEIGTAAGGTAKLLYNATRSRNVKIFTVDISPLRSAYENLKDTDVIIVPKPSSEFARLWKKEVNRPIDLLYIDGNHNFQYVYEDFTLWTPHLRPGGTVVFHDYDPPERGGIVHFGVRVCLDTILKLGVLRDTAHEYKLLIALLENPNNVRLTVEDCYKTLIEIGDDIKRFIDHIFADSLESGIRSIQGRKQGMDSLKACYCVDFLLRNGFESLANASHSMTDFLKWSEILAIRDHGHGISQFPDDMASVPVPKNIVQLSNLIAKEQLRISLLTMVLKSVIHWDV